MGKPYSLPFIIFSLLLLSYSARSQGLYKISMDEKISNSSLVVEGKVISKRSYWDKGHRMIYTANQVEVYKIFKGEWQKNTIEVITVGGVVDNYYIHASHQLLLDNNDIGIFFCKNIRADEFDVYSSSQGFLKYDLLTKQASAPFSEYTDIEKILYPELNNKIKERIQVKNASFSVEQTHSKLIIQSNSILAPAISSFAPTTVHAGALMDPTNNLLTISGTGFGTRSGLAAVQFQNANNNPGNYVETGNASDLIVSWSDTEIKIRVPGNAGTGLVRVKDAAGTIVASTSPLNVLFSVLTVEFGSGFPTKQFTLGNRNTRGGYDVKYSTNTANGGVDINSSDVKATFQRALGTWREQTGVNIVEGPVTTTSLQLVNPDDGENVVMFDNYKTNGNDPHVPLQAGVLATCYSGITICTNDPLNNQPIKTGFDIVIRNQGVSVGTTPFTFGPCPPYTNSSAVVDLETVLLHELGHAVNLGHVVDNFEGSGIGNINPPKVMNFSLTNNQRRISLDYSSVVGGRYESTDHNYTYGTCVGSSAKMVPLALNVEPKDNCPATFPTTITPNQSTVNFNLALASSNKLVDPGYNQMKTNNEGAPITNTVFYALRTNKSGGNLLMAIKNYSTVPGAVANCANGQGVEATGVKFSLYKTSSCPDGGDYPTPVTYNTFKANGELPLITGLDPETNYLLVLDGVQNTKAVFDIQFSGTALIEEATAEFGLTVAFNPITTSNITAYVLNDFAQTYNFVMRNVNGLPVYSTKTFVTTGRQPLIIPAVNLPNGFYFLTAYTEENKKLKTFKIVIRRK